MIISKFTVFKSIRASARKQLFYAFCKHKYEQNQNKIQQENVYKVYDKIAGHFSSTRYKPWPKVANFLHHLKRGSVVFDVGCGNGRNMSVNNGIQVIGIDRCLPLLKIAKDKSQRNNLMQCDAAKLPLRSSTCDAFICIALLHHFCSQKMRQDIINQLGRVLKTDGKGLIYVRAMQIINSKNQLVRELESQDFFVPWHLQQKYEDNLEKAIQQGHQYIPQKHAIIYQRFYHAFVKGQLEGLIENSNKFQIQKSYYDNSNWVCQVKKK